MGRLGDTMRAAPLYGAGLVLLAIDVAVFGGDLLAAIVQGPPLPILSHPPTFWAAFVVIGIALAVLAAAWRRAQRGQRPGLGFRMFTVIASLAAAACTILAVSL